MGDLISEPIFWIEFIIVSIIVILQIQSYSANKKRMDDYMNVFSDSESWTIEKDDIGRVSNIGGGSSSTFFLEIKHTINKYIAGSSDSVSDYQILKEAVDRHCDSIEDQIESQTPVPLYLGLAGTMIGVILGLMSLIFSGAITDLAGAQENQNMVTVSQNQNANREVEFKKATDGIGSLLLGVAVAMMASFVGITLTTLAAWNYKKRKDNAERRKNEFLSWMQSVLLPELPNDLSSAMAQLVLDLEDFNTTFEQNTSSLAKTFTNVNESYQTQAEIIKAVQEMDVQKMATANVKVLQQLDHSTEKLERFNQYLIAIQGYTATIQQFNEKFHQEESQLGLLKKIYDFFAKELNEIDQRKEAISDAVSSVDEKLKYAFSSLEQSGAEQITLFREKLQEQEIAFNNMLEEQKETFKTSLRLISDTLETEMNQRKTAFNNMLEEQKENFKTSYKLISEKLDEELSKFPETVAQLRAISQIPSELRALSATITKAMERISANALKGGVHENNNKTLPAMKVNPIFSVPKRLEWMLIAFFSVITIFSLLSAVFWGLAAFRYQGLPNNGDMMNTEETKDPVEAESSISPKDMDTQQIYHMVDQQPSFPGGNDALQAWLKENIQYPSNMKAVDDSKNVIVTFVVETDGSINEPKIARGDNPSLNKEAIRLVLSMPKWIPGKLKGEIVRVKKNLTIHFTP